MFTSVGTLQYGPGIRAVIWVDDEIAKYYRKLIPKYYSAQPQMYKAHITVVRTDKETPPNMEAWGKYQGEEIPFSYENEIQFDGTYFYLNAYSERIKEIRLELGLPEYRFDDNKKYHITIANVKN
jgi:hypothetical protein